MSSEDKCPVDHKSREAWLRAAESASSKLPPNHPVPTAPDASPSSSSPSPPPSNPHARLLKTRPLASDREVSTIPRATMSPSTTTPSASSAAATSASHGSAVPSNSETETGADARTGNWIYPSERMFFEAMKRKQHTPAASDMAAIVPIHNAVNERAWAEIKRWEARFGWTKAANHRCGGPKLVSFSGDSSRLTPRARWNVLLGYQAPFDRHDWVVERCPGEKGKGGEAGLAGDVEYVIDFYQGRGSEANKGLNFFLDVRPKLNSWEGWKMRALGLLGW